MSWLPSREELVPHLCSWHWRIVPNLAVSLLPEDCFEPQAFYKALGRVGVPHNELANLLEDGAEAKWHF